MIKSITLLIGLSTAVLLMAYATKQKREIHIIGDAQGTTYHITYVAEDSLVTKKQIDNIFDQIDSSLSIYKPYSLINKFNNARHSVTADKHLTRVVKRSLEIFKDTDGSFDITVYPLVTAWGFGSKRVNTMPDSAAIKAILPCVGSQKLKLVNGQLIKSNPCVKIDVNGIAQGYTADVVAGFLERHHIQNYLVEVGGEIRVRGRKADGNLMRIGIESPAQNSFDEPVVTKVIAMAQGAITTSGNYRKYIESNGQRISHLIDPKTGFSIKGDMISATVIAKDGITADGYDNPLMNMTINQALAFVTRHKNMEAYLIYHKPNGSLTDTATVGFYKLLIK